MIQVPWFLGLAMLASLMLSCGSGTANRGVPALPEESFANATMAHDLGDREKAFRELRHAIRGAPQNFEYRWFMSELMLEAGDPAGAELVLQRMIQLESDHPELPIRLARLQFMLGKNDELLKTELPATTSENLGVLAALHYLRGKALSRTGWNQEARDEYTQAIMMYREATKSAKVSPESLLLRRELWLTQETNEDLAAAMSHSLCANPTQQQSLDIFELPVRPTARVLRVGKGHPYAAPSDAAKVAKDGDIVEIAAGDYRGDTALWNQNNLILRGVNAGDKRVHLIAGPQLAQSKAIWVFMGRDIIVDNVEFSGAQNAVNNGAGIRFEGVNLTVLRSHFHNNQNGILTKGNRGSTVHIEFSEFGYNGAGDGFSHNIYVGAEDKLVFRYNYSHHANIGHLLKTRARAGDIRTNRFSDEQEALTSYLIDIPNGGEYVVVGNVLKQSFHPQNETLIAYGAEGSTVAINSLEVINNSAYNESVDGVFVYNHTSAVVDVGNNLFFGTNGKLVEGDARTMKNELTTRAAVEDYERLDFRLRSDSELIDEGIQLTARQSMNPVADSEYLHPANARPRPKAWKPDIGAFEYCRG